MNSPLNKVAEGTPVSEISSPESACLRVEVHRHAQPQTLSREGARPTRSRRYGSLFLRRHLIRFRLGCCLTPHREFSPSSTQKLVDGDRNNECGRKILRIL